MCMAEPNHKNQVRRWQPFWQKFIIHLTMDPFLRIHGVLYSPFGSWLVFALGLKKKSLLTTDTWIIYPFSFQLSSDPGLWFSSCTFGIFSGLADFRLPLLTLLWVLISPISLTELKTVWYSLSGQWARSVLSPGNKEVHCRGFKNGNDCLVVDAFYYHHDKILLPLPPPPSPW